MAQQDDKSCTLPKKADALNQGTKMDLLKEITETGSKVTVSPSQDSNSVVENGVSDHISEADCSEDVSNHASKDDCNGGISTKQCVIQQDDDPQNTTPSSDVTSDLQPTTCKSCLSGEAAENDSSTVGESPTTDGVQCDKCHRNFTLCNSPSGDSGKEHDQKVTKPLPELERCSMCDKTFESSELLDEHLMSLDSCRKVVPEDDAPSLRILDDAADASTNGEDTNENASKDIVHKTEVDAPSLPIPNDAADTSTKSDAKNQNTSEVVAHEIDKTLISAESETKQLTNVKEAVDSLNASPVSCVANEEPSLLPDTTDTDNVMDAETSKNNNESVGDKSPLIDSLDMEVIDEIDENNIADEEDSTKGTPHSPASVCMEVVDEDSNSAGSEIPDASVISPGTLTDDPKGTEEQVLASTNDTSTTRDNSPSPTSLCMEVTEEIDDADNISENTPIPDSVVEDSVEGEMEVDELEENTVETKDTDVAAEVSSDTQNVSETSPVKVISTVPDVIHNSQENVKSADGHEDDDDKSPSVGSEDTSPVKVISTVPDAIHNGQENTKSVDVDDDDKSSSHGSVFMEVVEETDDIVASENQTNSVQVLSTTPDAIHDSQEESVADKPPSPDGVYMEVVAESEVAKPVQVLAATLPDSVQDASHSGEKSPSTKTAESVVESPSDAVTVSVANSTSTTKLDDVKPTDKESPSKGNVANKSQDIDSDESGIIELIDSDTSEATDKLPLPTKLTTKDKTVISTPPKEPTEDHKSNGDDAKSSIDNKQPSNEDKKSSDDVKKSSDDVKKSSDDVKKSSDDVKKSSDEENKKNDPSLVIKKKFTTGNETLDQDIVEILQDATVSRGGRVTRSMRKVKEAKEAPSANAKSSNSKSSGVKSASPKAVKLITNKPGTQNIKMFPQTSMSNNSLQLQLPATAVTNGAKFMITIPKGNTSNTPAGQYLVTVSPTAPGEKPKVKTVLVKDSPSKDDIQIVNNRLPPTSSPELVAMESTPTGIIDSQLDKEQDEQLRKTVMLAKQTKKVYVRELEQIDDVIFECPKCKSGFPHMLLVQLHMEDCCHHPPTQRPTVHIRIPTEVLLKFYIKQVSNWTSKQPPAANRQTYQCICCQEVLLCRNYRIGKYYPHLSNHFAKHTSPVVKVVNYTAQGKIKELGDVLTVHSKQAVEWVDTMVPPFVLGNRPVSHKVGSLDGYLCTGNKLHQESLLLLEYDSDELDEEIYCERRKKEKRKKKKRGRPDDNGAYVCNWRAAIRKEDSSIVEVNEISTPKSAFPTDIPKSGSLKHSIVHSPLKSALREKAKLTQGKTKGKKKKAKEAKEVAKQLVFDDNRRRSPRKGGTDKVFVSLPQIKKHRNKITDDEIIVLSSEDESQPSVNSKETEAQAKKAKKPSVHTKPGRPRLPRQESVEDDSSRGSMVSLPESSTPNQAPKSATSSRASSIESRLPSANVGKDGDADILPKMPQAQEDDRPPSRGSNSSIICLSDSNEDDNGSPAKVDVQNNKAQSTSLMQQEPNDTSTKSVTQKVTQNNATPKVTQNNATQKVTQNNAAQNRIPESPMSAKRRVGNLQKSGVGPKSSKNIAEKSETGEEEGKKRQVPEATIDEDDEVMLISDEEEEEDDGVDLNGDNYDPLMLDKHQIKTYFQQSTDEEGIYECSLGGSTSCECVSESDLFEHMSQHLHVEKVHPQKRSKTILFKGKVVPNYLKLTKHQIWAHFCNITLDSDMEICDEYMQQYKQCRWANCAQRVWTKYGRLSHHLRSHLRFTQIDNKRYYKMRDARSLSGAGSDSRSSYPNSPIRNVPTGVVSDQVLCLPEDLILGKYKYGKSPDRNIRGTFSCIACSFCHHLDNNAVAVLTVKILACHLKHHLPQGATHQCLITPKALKSSLDPDDYAARVGLHHIPADIASIRYLPDDIVTSCYYTLKMKFVEAATMGVVVPPLNKDGVLYRCLYAGCLIGVQGGKATALLRHIREHVPAVTGASHSLPPQLPAEQSPHKSSPIAQNKKRKASADVDDDDDITIVQSSKHIRTLDFDETSKKPNMQATPVKTQASMVKPKPVQTFFPDGSSMVQDVPGGKLAAPVTSVHSKPAQMVFFADGSSKVQNIQGNIATSSVNSRPNPGHTNQTSHADDATLKVRVTPQSNGPKPVAAAESVSSDDDIVELIDDESSQDSNQMLYDEQPMDIASQDDSQDSIAATSGVPQSPGKIPGELATGVISEDGSNRRDLPEWSTNNRGVHSATGIEPSRDSPSRSMNELRQNPHDVIVCSMPDVEAFFSEHIVKFSSYVSSLSFGKPSYSCPECGVTGLRGTALKEHLEEHVGKKIKWKSLTQKNPVLEPQLGSPAENRTMLKLKRSLADRNRPHRKKLCGVRWEGKNGAMKYTRKDNNVKLVGPGVKKARLNFNNLLGRILQRERNIRRGKLTRSPLKRLSSLGATCTKAKANTCRRSILSGESSKGKNDLSTQVKGQSSNTKDADIVKQSCASVDKQVQQESCLTKANVSQTDTEVVDLVDSDALEIISINSDDTEMTNAIQLGQGDVELREEPVVQSGDDLFLTIDDILKVYFTKEEKQRSRKGLAMNFIVVQYKCRRCNFTTLTVLDVPEHVAFHIKRKVILKIAMDK